MADVVRPLIFAVVSAARPSVDKPVAAAPITVIWLELKADTAEVVRPAMLIVVSAASEAVLMEIASLPSAAT